MIGKNIKALRKKAGMTQCQFAAKIGLNRSTLADYEIGSCSPKAERLKEIATFFGITVDQLITDNVGVSDISSPSSLKVLAITVDGHGRENIEFVPHTAQAGYLKGYSDPSFILELPRFNLPKIGTGTYRAFEILGDSMPPINSGSIVIGQYIEKISDIKNNYCYILVSKEGGIVFKRVIKQPKSLKLISDNISFPPYTLLIDEILEAWFFHSFIGFSNGMNDSFDKVESIIDTLNRIDSKIDLLVNH